MLAILQSLLHLMSIVAYEGDAITGQVFQNEKTEAQRSDTT